MIKNYKKYIAGMFLCSTLFSCGEDPVLLKEQMIKKMKNQENSDDDEPENPTPQSDPKPSTNGDFVEQHFSFDIWKKVPNKEYAVPLNSNNENPSKSYWVSASNYGYAYAGAPDNNYPATELKNGYKGSGVKLVTKQKVGNLTAGSIYTGYIDTKSFVTKRNPPRFGQNWKGNEPVKIKFYYKYEIGKGKKYGNTKGKDFGGVKVILYEVTDAPKFYLDKHTLNKHERIVMKAYEKLENVSTWISKTAELKVINNKRYNVLDFKNKKYRLAIVFSSSARGSDGIGIVGSTLQIDEATLYSKKD